MKPKEIILERPRCWTLVVDNGVAIVDEKCPRRCKISALDIGEGIIKEFFGI